jgi:sugar O-acyltransferase (sialic acid O-acetyltransferase NeuD family)
MNTQLMSTKNKIVVFGTNDFAELAHYYISNDTSYEVVGFTVHEQYLKDKFYKPRSSEKSYPVVPFENINQHYSTENVLLFAPMTGARMNNVRKSVYLEGKQKGYEFYSYVSSRATVCHNKIGENCFILEDNTLQPFTSIGNNVVLWSGNHIGHHGVIEDHVFFTSHVVLSGHCHVKERAWLGVNSTVRDGITIEEGCLVAMGSLVTKSTEQNSFYMGSPAKKQSKSSMEIM